MTTVPIWMLILYMIFMVASASANIGMAYYVRKMRGIVETAHRSAKLRADIVRAEQYRRMADAVVIRGGIHG